MAQKGLGRGLSALFDDGAAADGSAGAGVQTLPVADLSPSPFQPRQHFDAEKIAELAASIKTQGILQPILVRAASPGVKTPYEIVAGERRWRAAQQARVHDVPVVIRELANADAAEIALLENVQREDLSPFEEAEGYRGLMAQFGYSQSDVAERVGKSRAHVANALRLLAMPDSLRTMVEKGELSAGHARALLSLENPLLLARQAAAENWSVRRLEQAVRDIASGVDTAGSGDRSAGTGALDKDPDLREAEEQASRDIGLGVEIRGSATRGHVRISYASLEQLELVLARLAGK